MSNMSKKDQLFLDDILESAQAIQGYVENIDMLTFIKDRKTYSATIREFLRRSLFEADNWRSCQ